MSDMPSGFDPGSQHPTPPPTGPATGVNPVPTPTPPGPPLVRRSDDQPGRMATVIFGLIVVAIGLWFFADQTLGLDLPRLSWSELWPVFLILVGGWLLYTSMRRR